MAERRQWALACAALGALWATPAHAYECARVSNIYQVPSGPSLSWPVRKIHYSVHDGGSGITQQMDPDAALDRVQDAFKAWTQNPLQLAGGVDPGSCPLVPPAKVVGTDIEFVYDGPFDQAFAGYNYLAGPAGNRNMVIFRDDFWPYENTAHARAIALTTASIDTISGTIFDSDIEINTRMFNFYAGLDAPDATQTDLLNTLVHEVGHVLGFGHSTDANASMYQKAEAQEVKKRHISCDDATLLAFRYGPGAEVGYCSSQNRAETCGDCQGPGELSSWADITIASFDAGLEPGGCAAAPAGLAPWWAPLVAAGGGRRRRRRARAEAPSGGLRTAWPAPRHLVDPGVHEPPTRRDR